MKANKLNKHEIILQCILIQFFVRFEDLEKLLSPSSITSAKFVPSKKCSYLFTANIINWDLRSPIETMTAYQWNQILITQTVEQFLPGKHKL